MTEPKRANAGDHVTLQARKRLAAWLRCRPTDIDINVQERGTREAELREATRPDLPPGVVGWAEGVNVRFIPAHTEEQIQSLIGPGAGMYLCITCGENLVSETRMREHSRHHTVAWRLGMILEAP